MTNYLYSARFLPLDTPVLIPVEGGKRERLTFTEDNFAIERKSRNPGKVLLNHDLLKQIGKVQNLWRHDGWFIADFTLDAEITTELHVGQPVSCGLSLFHSGSRYFSEISIVSDGAVEGAEITRKVELKPAAPPRPLTLEESRRLEERLRALGIRCEPGTFAPLPPLDTALRKPVATPPRPKPAPVLARRLTPDQRNHRAEDDELRRRMDWLESQGLEADMEVVHRNMRRELDGPSLHDLVHERRLAVVR